MTRLLLLLSVITLLSNGAIARTRFEDSLKESRPRTAQNAITFDVGFASGGSDAAGGWRQKLALRAGIRRILTKSLTATVYLDYYDHIAILGDHLEPVWLSPPSPRRSDIAFYGGLSLFQIIFLGAGSYYTKSDAVVFLFEHGSSHYPDSGLSEFRFFYIVGLTYDIHICDALFLPLGLYYRNSYTTNNTFGPVNLKIGVGTRF
jgi:hypothetical protein